MKIGKTCRMTGQYVPQEEYISVITASSVPGLVSIECTAIHPGEWAKRLSNGVGEPLFFSVFGYVSTLQPQHVYQRVLVLLDDHLCDGSTKVFQTDAEEALQLIEKEVRRAHANYLLDCCRQRRTDDLMGILETVDYSWADYNLLRRARAAYVEALQSVGTTGAPLQVTDKELNVAHKLFINIGTD